jgi:dihydrofolate reductase
MGSRTYYDMAAFWPYSDSPLAPAMNDIPKVIFSRSGIKDGTPVDRPPGVTPTSAVLQSWAEPTVARGDLAEEVLRLKKQSGNFILAQGGAQFAQSLVTSGLIDEYRMVTHPN